MLFFPSFSHNFGHRMEIALGIAILWPTIAIISCFSGHRMKKRSVRVILWPTNRSISQPKIHGARLMAAQMTKRGIGALREAIWSHGAQKKASERRRNGPAALREFRVKADSWPCAGLVERQVLLGRTPLLSLKRFCRALERPAGQRAGTEKGKNVPRTAEKPFRGTNSRVFVPGEIPGQAGNAVWGRAPEIK